MLPARGRCGNAIFRDSRPGRQAGEPAHGGYGSNQRVELFQVIDYLIYISLSKTYQSTSMDAQGARQDQDQGEGALRPGHHEGE